VQAHLGAAEAVSYSNAGEKCGIPRQSVPLNEFEPPFLNELRRSVNRPLI
jgi:hypothetical protein